MGRTAYPRTIVEKAPSHDGKPCFTAWRMVERVRDVETPPSEEHRPKWSLQIYDTTPAAVNPEHISAIAQKIHESTWPARGSTGRRCPDRIEVHGLPLPADASDAQRVDICVSHQKDEIDERYYSRNAEFFIPPTFQDFWQHHWSRRFIIICKPEDQWNEDDSFLDVSFEALEPTPDEVLPDNGPRVIPDVNYESFSETSRLHLVDRLERLRGNIEWFNQRYVGSDGKFRDDWNWELVKLKGR